MKTYTVQEIANAVNGSITGNTTESITSPEQLSAAGKGQITFIGNKKYEKLWAESKASAAIVNNDISIEPGDNRVFIKVQNADLAMSKLLELFTPPAPLFKEAIHSAAVIHPTAVIGNGVRIGSGCYIGANCVIEDNATLYANVTVLDDSTIGKNTILWPGVVVRERSKIGSYCILHPNASIGADGFGFTPCPERGLAKIPQIGNVVIGNYVEIGANACVDRGKFSSTIIGDGCKIDNLVQIGHNSVMGRFCIMAGNSGLAGSVTLGDGVVIGGSASIKDHVTIGSGATVGAGSGVTCDVEPGKTVLGYPAVEGRKALKQWAALKRLADS